MTRTVKRIVCKGTPYEIGQIHGQNAKSEIERGIAFYAKLFMSKSKRSWPQVRETAGEFESVIKEKWPRYHEELKGIADGAQLDVLDIVAINVRTEIAFGLFSDGCTSLYWKDDNHTFLGQNWDWQEAQKENIVQLTIIQDGLPVIKMMTEAGLIGKIGTNSKGVGICFNAIRAKGLDASRLPAHLGLRMALESDSTQQAVEKLESFGMASSAHMLIGDPNEAVGLEFTSTTLAKLPVDADGMVPHSNHLIGEHPGVNEPAWMACSPFRVDQMKKNAVAAGSLSWKTFSGLFEDETNHPAAICRTQTEKTGSATLFNIVMELRERKAVVKMGRPVQVEETLELSFD